MRRRWNRILLRPRGDGERTEAADARATGRSIEYALSSQQSIALVVSDLCLSADGAIARAGFGWDGVGASDGGQREAEGAEGGRAGAYQRASSVCAIELKRV